MLIPRCKFVVVLEIESVTKLPQSKGHMQVKWHIMDSARADTRGRTKPVDVVDHRADLNYRTEFTYNLGVGFNKQLRSSSIVFEADWYPMDNKNRMSMGSVTLDIAQFVGREPDKMLFLLEDAKANVLMTIQLQVRQVKGPSNYQIPEFNAPVMNEKIQNIGIDNKLSPDRELLLRPLTGKKIYYRYVQHFKQSPSHPNVLNAVADILTGGDGFCSVPPPEKQVRTSLVEKIAAGEKITGVVNEDELRDDYISWVIAPMKAIE